MSGDLHTKYRPSKFAEVIGQKAAVSSLKVVVADNSSHAFILSGPSGVGKTTLARIVAGAIGCEPASIMEVNAAKYTGIDDMRALEDILYFRPFGGGNRGVIIDEAHGLSRQAWQSLLKIVEEPPEFVYFFFCTTELGKIPKTILTRCHKSMLQPVKDAELLRLVEKVAEAEKIDLDETVADVIVKEAKGSPREALVNLASAGHCTNKKEAAALLHSAQGSDATLELCRFVMKGGSWVKAMTIFARLEEEGAAPESVRIVCANYIAAALKAAKGEGEAVRMLTILENFSTAYNQSDGSAPLLLSIGRTLFADQ